MWLIIGLGNPEKEYEGTRHNVGFEVINKLAYDHNIEINKAKHRAHIGEGFIAGKKVILAKPQTFMNLSGESVRDLMGFYKPAPEELIVVYDDISLSPGEIRIREKGSAGGHNGMKNILYQLETDEFPRVKVGIGEKPRGWDLADFVLSKFKKEEQENILFGMTDAADAVALIIKEGTNAAMNRFNKKTGANKSDE
jgi:PTH1 family peptidyl-tRNA hydrolase